MIHFGNSVLPTPFIVRNFVSGPTWEELAQKGDVDKRPSGSLLVRFIRGLRDAKISCGNISPKNLVIRDDDSGELCLIDVGVDIVPWNQDEEELACKRLFLMWQYFHIPMDTLNILLKEVRRESDMPETSGYQALLALIEPDDDKCVTEEFERVSKEYDQRLFNSNPVDYETSLGVIVFRYHCEDFNNDIFLKNLYMLKKKLSGTGVILISVANAFFEARAPLAHVITRLCSKADLYIDQTRHVSCYDIDSLLPTSKVMILCLIPIVSQSKNPAIARKSTSLMIKTCAMEVDEVSICIPHLIRQLDLYPRSFDERVVVIDSKKTDFLRGYNEGNYESLIKELEKLKNEFWIDRIVKSDSDPQSTIQDWFNISDISKNATHAENGVQVSSFFEGIDKCTGEIILQVDLDVVVGRNETISTNRISNFVNIPDFIYEAEYLFDQDPLALTLSLSPFSARNEVSRFEFSNREGRPFRVESRASFFQRDRLLASKPLKPFEFNSTTGSFKQGWYRLLDNQISKDGNGWRSYRCSSSNIGFIHPDNSLKSSEHKGDYHIMRWMVEIHGKRVVPDFQFDKVHFHNERGINLADWKQNATRNEKFVFLCVGGGSMLTPSKALRCIKSLQSQSTRDIPGWGAVIIVDDCSDDGKQGKVGEFLFDVCKKDSRISVIRTFGKLGSMRNTISGILHFVTEKNAIIATLDLDDYLPNSLVYSKVWKLFYSNPSLHVAIGGMTRTDKILRRFENEETVGIFLPITIENCRELRAAGNVWSHFRVFSRHIFLKIQDEDLRDGNVYFDTACDWAFMLPICEMAREWKVIDFHSYVYDLKTERNVLEREIVISKITNRTRYSRLKWRVAVIGSASLLPTSKYYSYILDFSRNFGSLAAEAGYIIVTGGLDGVMKEVCRGSKSSGGTTIGILPGHDPMVANPFVDHPIATNLGDARNALVTNSDAIVIIGGGAGTLSEACLAWSKRRLIISAIGTGAAADDLAGKKIDSRDRKRGIHDCVFSADSPAAAMKLLNDKLPFYYDH
ncbi:hypothetical protein HK096_000795, partial [Nowakowskiella sp. JEL0078]